MCVGRMGRARWPGLPRRADRAAGCRRSASPSAGRAQRSTAGAEPGSGRPADSDMNHTATPPTTAAAIM
ncbi:hypothetical protein SUDANB6_04205 [Streptomyces sp. enrichment culture]